MWILIINIYVETVIFNACFNWNEHIVNYLVEYKVNDYRRNNKLVKNTENRDESVIHFM